MAEEDRPKVSIIVPCRNERSFVRGFLESLLRQDFSNVECEIIVADGMSDDGTREILEECSRRHPQIRVIDNPGKIVSSGLNAAVRMSRGDFIIRMDVHTEYAPDYVQQCLRVMEETGADNVGGPWTARGKGYLSRAIAAVFHSPFGSGWAKGHDVSHEGRVETVYLGCWRKATLERLGLFDESLVRNQDDELNLRLVRSKGTIWQSPRIVSWYSPRGTLRGLVRQYFQYGFWKVPVIRKHRLPASWRHLAPGAFITANAGLGLAAALSQLFHVDSAPEWLLGTWAAILAIYAFACLAASVQAANRKGWTLLPVLPFVFAAYHLSYGLGFTVGLVYWTRKGTADADAAGLFTEITR